MRGYEADLRVDMDVAHFTHWVGSHRPHAPYDYCDSGHCPMASYLRSHEFSEVGGGPGRAHGTRRDGVEVHVYIPEEVEEVLSTGEKSHGWTFGELHKRLLAL